MQKKAHTGKPGELLVGQANPIPSYITELETKNSEF